MVTSDEEGTGSPEPPANDGRRTILATTTGRGRLLLYDERQSSAWISSDLGVQLTDAQ